MCTCGSEHVGSKIGGLIDMICVSYIYRILEIYFSLLILIRVYKLSCLICSSC